MDKITFLQGKLGGWLDFSISTFLNPCSSLVNQANSLYWNGIWKFFWHHCLSYWHQFCWATALVLYQVVLIYLFPGTFLVWHPAFLRHPECPCLGHGSLEIQGVCNALVYMCFEALRAVIWASEVLCILYVLFHMNPLADLQIGGK